MVPPPDETTSTADAIDVPSLRDRVAGQLSLLRELLAVFHQQYPSQLALLRESVATSDGDALRKSAHRLIGTLACFSATRAVAAARALERAAASGDTSNAADGVATIEREVEAAMASLAEVVARGFDEPGRGGART